MTETKWAAIGRPGVQALRRLEDASFDAGMLEHAEAPSRRSMDRIEGELRAARSECEALLATCLPASDDDPVRVAEEMALETLCEDADSLDSALRDLNLPRDGDEITAEAVIRHLTAARARIVELENALKGALETARHLDEKRLEQAT